MKRSHRVWPRNLLIIAVSVSLSLVRGSAWGHEPPRDQTPPEAARGVAGSLDIKYTGPRLRAKPVRDAEAPMLVRVRQLSDTAYRIEYMGLVTGSYNLSELIEREDGRPAESLPNLNVRIISQLPPDHGADVFGLTPPGISLTAHYQSIMWIAGILWVAVPVVVVGRRLLRRTPPVFPPVAAPEPTASDLLRQALQAASGRELSVHERGRLELLLLHVLLADPEQSRRLDSIDSLARAVADVRQDPRTAELVLAVERWLHDRRGPGAAEALAALERFRMTTLDTPRSTLVLASQGAAS